MSNVLNCPKSPISGTTTQQKLKSKQAAFTFRHGTPKIRDIIREKCRIRIKEARSANFADHRNLKPNNKLLITKIVREELADIEEDIKLQEFIYEEIIDEINEWFIKEFENEQNYLIDVSESSIIFCPVCQLSNLKQAQGTLYCDCGIRFDYSGNIEHFQNRIKNMISEHELQCNEKFKFYIEPNTESVDSFLLNALCEKCDKFVCFS